jgi:hypothetical protein
MRKQQPATELGGANSLWIFLAASAIVVLVVYWMFLEWKNTDSEDKHGQTLDRHVKSPDFPDALLFHPTNNVHDWQRPLNDPVWHAVDDAKHMKKVINYADF